MIIVLDTERFEEIIDAVTEKIYLANRTGELESLLSDWGLSSLIENDAPMPLENALTLFNQLFGFFISSATLKSHSVASAINCSIIMVPLLNVFCLSILYLASKAVVRDR